MLPFPHGPGRSAQYETSQSDRRKRPQQDGGDFASSVDAVLASLAADPATFLLPNDDDGDAQALGADPDGNDAPVMIKLEAPGVDDDDIMMELVAGVDDQDKENLPVTWAPSPKHSHQHARSPTSCTSSATSSAASSPAVSGAAGATTPKNSKPVLPPEVLAQLPLPPRSANQDQRERNRLIVKRCYYKKISTLNELRGELERQETRYQLLLRQKRDEGIRPTTAEELAREKSRAEELHAAYVQLALVSDALRRENEELRRIEAEYSQMEKAMAQLRVAQVKAQRQAQELQEHKRLNPIIETRPLTPADCAEMVQEAYKRITSFRGSKGKFSTGASLFGWRDCHQVKDDRLYFSLEKTFQGRSAASVARSAWAVLSDPETLGRTYSTRLQVLYHEVQRLDDDHVVFYHTLERPGSDLRVKALMLATRVDLDAEGRSSLILFRGLDPKRYVLREGEPPRPRDRRGRSKIEPQKEDIWMDTFIWGLFQPTGPHGEHGLSDFGGTIDGTALLAAGWWMVEMLQFAMRIETQIIGPQFVLLAPE